MTERRILTNDEMVGRSLAVEFIDFPSGGEEEDRDLPDDPLERIRELYRHALRHCLTQSFENLEASSPGYESTDWMNEARVLARELAAIESSIALTVLANAGIIVTER